MAESKKLAKDTRVILVIVVFIIIAIGLWQAVLPWIAEFYYRKGFVENTYSKFEDSIVDLDKAFKCAPWETYYLITQVRNYEEMSHKTENRAEQEAWLKKAYDMYQYMVKINPTNPWYYNGLAAIDLSLFNMSQTIPLRKKYYDEAGDAYLKATQIDRLNPLFQMSLAFYYHRSGKMDEAIRLYHLCTKLDSWFVEAWYNLGEIELSKGNYDNAIFYFDKIAQADKENEIVRDDGSKVYTDWVKGGNYNNFRAKLGELYLAKHDFAKAEEMFKWAIDMNKDDARLWKSLGIAYHQEGKIEQAIFAYKQALSLDPDMQDVYKYLGYAYYSAHLVNSSMENLRHYIGAGGANDEKARDDLQKIGILSTRQGH